jgi:hypothetical protein
MKAKTKVDLFFGEKVIPSGTILNVSPTKENIFYEILDGPYQGHQYWIHHFEKVELTYTEKQWNDMENHYMAELDKVRAKYDRAIILLIDITKQAVKKNKEIEKLEFYVSALTIGLTASSEAITIIRNSDKV